jgi:hypothetical protein
VICASVALVCPGRTATPVRLANVQPGDRAADDHPLDLTCALEDREDSGLRGSFFAGQRPADPCGISTDSAPDFRGWAPAVRVRGSRSRSYSEAVWKPAAVKAGIIPAPEKDRRDRVRYATIRKEGRAGCRVTANTGPMREPRTVLRRMPCTIAEFQACASDRDCPFRSAFGRWHRPTKGVFVSKPQKLLRET